MEFDESEREMIIKYIVARLKEATSKQLEVALELIIRITFKE